MNKKKKNRKCGWRKLLPIVAFVLSCGVFNLLWADTSVATTFSLELKEWLVLEIKSASGGFSNTGNSQALGQTLIVSGQPLELRILLSVNDGKTVSLKGIIYPEEETLNNQPVLIWHGQGDIQGGGQVLYGQENTFAVWRGSGLKTGSLVFLEPGNNSGSVYKAVFTLSSF